MEKFYELTRAKLALLEGGSPPESPKSQTRDPLDEQTQHVFTSKIDPEQKSPRFPAIELSSSPHSFLSTNSPKEQELPPWIFPVLSRTQPFTIGKHTDKHPIRQPAPESPADTSGLTEWVQDLVLEPKGESEQEWPLYAGDPSLIRPAVSSPESAEATEEASELSDEGDDDTERLEEPCTIASFDRFNEWPFVDSPLESTESEEDISPLSPFTSPRHTEIEPLPPYVRIVTQVLPNSSFADAAKNALENLQAQTTSSETALRDSYLSTKEIQPKHRIMKVDGYSFSINQ